MANRTSLKQYYERFFPFEELVNWLSLVNTTDKDGIVFTEEDKSDPLADIAVLPQETKVGLIIPRGIGFHRMALDNTNKMWTRSPLEHREFAFWFQTADGSSAVSRRLSFSTWEKLRDSASLKVPSRIEIGAVYRTDASCKDSPYCNLPYLTELRFDFDMTEKRPFLYCCGSTKTICERCWIFIRCALKCTAEVLRVSFGIEHTQIVFSGNKGAHLFATGFDVASLSQHARANIINLFSGMLSPRLFDLACNPAIEICLPIMKKELVAYYSKAESVAFLASSLSTGLDSGDLDRLKKYLESTVTFITELSPVQVPAPKYAFKSNRDYPQQVEKDSPWAASYGPMQRAVANHKQDLDHINATLRLRTLLRLMAPQPDQGVTKQPSHLIKAPWCINPTTGKVCVPIGWAKLDEFSPDQVQTLEQVIQSGELRRDWS